MLICRMLTRPVTNIHAKLSISMQYFLSLPWTYIQIFWLDINSRSRPKLLLKYSMYSFDLPMSLLQIGIHLLLLNPCMVQRLQETFHLPLPSVSSLFVFEKCFINCFRTTIVIITIKKSSTIIENFETINTYLLNFASWLPTKSQTRS